MKKKVMLLVAVLFMNANLAGCGSSQTQALVEIPRDIYQKAEYQTVEAGRGDMQPILNLKLKPRDVEKIHYSVDEDNLVVDEVCVNVGDYVKEGQTLISFQSDEIKKNIEKYSSDVVRKQLLLDHYVRMYNMDHSKDKEKNYAVILQELTDDVELAKLYLQEEQQRFGKCQVVATKDGVISFLSKTLLSGYAEATQTLIIESCGKNQFETKTEDLFEFNIGDIYTAEYQDDEYEMEVVEVTDEGEGVRTIVFEPVYEVLNTESSDVLDMEIVKPALSNVVYVDRHAVHTKNGQRFVYVEKDNGFLEAVYVETGVEENGVMAILKGLDGTEKVAIK